MTVFNDTAAMGVVYGGGGGVAGAGIHGLAIPCITFEPKARDSLGINDNGAVVPGWDSVDPVLRTVAGEDVTGQEATLDRWTGRVTQAGLWDFEGSGPKATSYSVVASGDLDRRFYAQLQGPVEAQTYVTADATIQAAGTPLTHIANDAWKVALSGEVVYGYTLETFDGAVGTSFSTAVVTACMLFATPIGYMP